MKGEIIIIDAFITNSINETKLLNFIENIKKTRIPILLVSNTIISKEIISIVDYYIYDSNNRLLGDNFTNIDKFILWEVIGDIKLNTFHQHSQKHALSVMVNLLNSLWFLKSLGFKYFHRIEYDTILGDETIELIKINLSECIKQNKKGYFILNHDSQTQTFQYFLCEIDYFLKIIPEIKSENDYIEMINKNFETTDFVILEKIMYKLLNNNDRIKIIEWRNFEFSDSIWNTVSSDVYLEEKYKNTRTNLYLGENNNIIFSKQYIEDQSERLIELYINEEKISQILHKLDGLNSYFFNFIGKDINKIVVSENNNIIDIIDVKNEINFYEKIN
jgi:hypothetical protein